MNRHRVFVIAAALCLNACGGSNGSPTTPDPGTTPTLSAPALESPAADQQLDTLRPTLTVRNVTSDQAGTRTYEFQISDTTAFTAALTSHVTGFAATTSASGVAEGTNGTTSFTPASDLQPATRFYWRARAMQGTATGAWSATGTFRSKLVGFNRAGELYDPLIHEETIGTRFGNTTFLGQDGIRLNTSTSYVRYTLAQTLTSGEISVEVEGLKPNSEGQKSRIFSMSDGASRLFDSDYLFNVQYRGLNGNPPNAISYKVLMGDDDLKYEPERSVREASVTSLSPTTTYLWTARWGSTFRLIVRRTSDNKLIYDRSHSTPGTYDPSPHRVFLGANDADIEFGTFAGATYRNLWVGSGPRPVSLGSALRRP